jgi:hypothetical protein
MTHWIGTLHGYCFDFDRITLNTFDPQEVATVLSREGRFVNQTRWPYSDAQHSVLMARKAYNRFRKSFVPDHVEQLQLLSLLHDTPEVWVGDKSSPLKAYLHSKKNFALAELEDQIWNWVATGHKLPLKDEGALSLIIYGQLRQLDLEALATEHRDLMHEEPKWEMELPNPWSEPIEPWHPDYARDQWLKEYHRLCLYLNVFPNRLIEAKQGDIIDLGPQQ